ncbi:hypothetical protein [Bradyrhizobium sp. LTSP849]|uniref:hypothetical protein n=1 Tax=Bradyrhizobium sp. LTSP849 TaxID=1615890 RepID=UPI0012E0240A|nr:hypothetical protein [Bradyrhizobium sp. LTSP849]
MDEQRAIDLIKATTLNTFPILSMFSVPQIKMSPWSLQSVRHQLLLPIRIRRCAITVDCSHAAAAGAEEGSGLAGLIVVSGRVRMENRAGNPNAKRVETYYGTTSPEELDRLSPVSHVGPDSIPTLVAWGEYENPHHRRALRRTRT